MSEPNVWWSGPLLDDTGYAAEGRLLVRGLREQDVKVRARSLQRADLIAAGERNFAAAITHGCEQKNFHIVHAAWAYPAPSAPAVMRTIWRTMFETDSLPSSWVARAEEVDEIWVPSSHNMQTFAAAGVSREKMRILHEPLDASSFLPYAARRRETTAEEFVFLSVFTWQLRKGWDVLLRAYFEEFDASDRVLLVLRCDPFTFGEGGKSHILGCIGDFRGKFGGDDPPPVRLIEPHVEEEDLADLYAAADCFVLPSRGEGWARPLMEAIAMGVPAITTGWGGQMEFVDSDNARLIDYELVPVSPAAENEYMLFSGHRWAEPSIDHLKQELRAVSRTEKGRRNSAAAASTREKFDYPRVARRIMELLGRAA